MSKQRIGEYFLINKADNFGILRKHLIKKFKNLN